MLGKIKALIQSGFILIGYKVVSAVDEDGLDKIGSWINRYGFRHVLDIGANEGQFASKARKKFPNAFIHSFEPLPHVYQKLKKEFHKDANFKSYNIALGSEKGISTIVLNHHSASSSMLQMSEEFSQHFNFVKADREIEINVERLDDVFDNSKLQTPYLVKIDVQGFEREVIAGGREVLSNADVIIIEVSFHKLYNNQVLFDEIYDNMNNLGFKYSGNLDQLSSPINGEILQADALFVKVR